MGGIGEEEGRGSRSGSVGKELVKAVARGGLSECHKEEEKKKGKRGRKMVVIYMTSFVTGTTLTV